MNYFSILILFCISYGFGSFLLKKDDPILRIAIGLAAIPIIGVIFKAIHIPQDWRIFLGLALIAPVYRLVQWWEAGRKMPVITFKRPSWQAVTLFIIFVFAILLYCWGPFQYHWLEDDDSWSHAAGIKYVAVERNLNAPDGLFQYLNPYPPGYDLIIGLMHQINPSLYWTLKFFNGLFVCLSFLFFNLFAQELTQSRSKAVLATFFLALIPCYLTHFIWAHSLVITFFFPAFYFLLKSFKEKQYILPAALCCSAVTLTQPTQAIKFVIMAGLLLIAYLPTKIRWRNIGLVTLIAGILALSWWGPVIVQSLSEGTKVALRKDTQITGEVIDTTDVAKNIFSPTTGTGTRAYNWEDYVFIPCPNLINSPTGLGPIMFIISIIGLLVICLKLIQKISPPDQSYLITTLLWLMFTFLGMNSMTFHLPVGLFAFRFWLLFAIPIALICAEFTFSLTEYIQNKWRKILVIILLLLCVLRINLPFKWWFNTNEWPYGVHWASKDDLTGYVWMRENFPPNTRVFAFTDNVLVIGHDMRADFWTPEYQERLGHAFTQDIDQLYQNLTALDYECLVVSPRDIWEFRRENVNQKLKLLVKDSRFRLLYNNSAVKIFQILK